LQSIDHRKEKNCNIDKSGTQGPLVRNFIDVELRSLDKEGSVRGPTLDNATVHHDS